MCRDRARQLRDVGQHVGPVEVEQHHLAPMAENEPHSEPWGERRAYQYGAPLGVDQFFADKPPVGVA